MTRTDPCKHCMEPVPGGGCWCSESCRRAEEHDYPEILVGHLSAEPWQEAEDDLIRRDDEAKSREGYR